MPPTSKRSVRQRGGGLDGRHGQIWGAYPLSITRAATSSVKENHVSMRSDKKFAIAWSLQTGFHRFLVLRWQQQRAKVNATYPPWRRFYSLEFKS